jgi:hypothetical protein
MAENQSDIFTAELTNSSLTITPSMGVKKVSIFNSTAVLGTVIGTRNLAGLASSSINIAESETFTVVAENSVIASLVITAAAGCTLKIVAE